MKTIAYNQAALHPEETKANFTKLPYLIAVREQAFEPSSPTIQQSLASHETSRKPKAHYYIVAQRPYNAPAAEVFPPNQQRPKDEGNSA
jgi:electron transfer flavoprotein alpha/beta subunit